MQAMAQQESGNMQHTKRDTLIRRFFLVRNERGQIVRAGQIRGKTEHGDYLVTIFIDLNNDKSNFGECVSPQRLTAEAWMLFSDESQWRRAFQDMEKANW